MRSRVCKRICFYRAHAKSPEFFYPTNRGKHNHLLKNILQNLALTQWFYEQRDAPWVQRLFFPQNQLFLLIQVRRSPELYTRALRKFSLLITSSANESFRLSHRPYELLLDIILEKLIIIADSDANRLGELVDWLAEEGFRKIIKKFGEEHRLTRSIILRTVHFTKLYKLYKQVYEQIPGVEPHTNPLDFYLCRVFISFPGNSLKSSFEGVKSSDVKFELIKRKMNREKKWPKACPSFYEWLDTRMGTTILSMLQPKQIWGIAMLDTTLFAYLVRSTDIGERKIKQFWEEHLKSDSKNDRVVHYCNLDYERLLDIAHIDRELFEHLSYTIYTISLDIGLKNWKSEFLTFCRYKDVRPPTLSQEPIGDRSKELGKWFGIFRGDRKCQIIYSNQEPSNALDGQTKKTINSDGAIIIQVTSTGKYTLHACNQYEPYFHKPITNKADIAWLKSLHGELTSLQEGQIIAIVNIDDRLHRLAQSYSGSTPFGNPRASKTIHRLPALESLIQDEESMFNLNKRMREKLSFWKSVSHSNPQGKKETTYQRHLEAST